MSGQALLADDLAVGRSGVPSYLESTNPANATGMSDLGCRIGVFDAVLDAAHGHGDVAPDRRTETTEPGIERRSPGRRTGVASAIRRRGRLYG